MSYFFKDLSNDGPSFLKIGVTLVCFQIDGILPLSREKLNMSSKGDDRGCASSLRILLLIKRDPGVLPVGRERAVDLTSSDVILRDWRLLGGVILVRGSEHYVRPK